MNLLSKSVWILWRAGHRLLRAVNKLKFGWCATFENQVVVLPGASVLNMRKDKQLVHVGQRSVLAGELRVFAHGGSISMGRECFFGEGSRIWSATSIEIGNNVLISHNVNIHDTDAHPVDYRIRREHYQLIADRGHPERAETVQSLPVVIEDDVWIGFNSTILKGVTVGARSIIAAGSLVTKSVPPDSIHFGAGRVETLGGKQDNAG